MKSISPSAKLTLDGASAWRCAPLFACNGDRNRRRNAPSNEFGPRRGARRMRWRGLEPPRACAHKALNLARLPIPPPARGAIVPGAVLREQSVQDHGVEEEEHRDHRRQAREVALDDVGSAL